MRVLFINEIDIFENASAGITIRDLFGEELCENSLAFQIISNRSLKAFFNREQILYAENYTLSFFRLLKLIRQYNPDAIYTTGYNGKTLVLILMIKILSNLPVLIHYYDNWREYGKKWIKNALLSKIESKEFGALVISQEMKIAYEHQYGNRYKVLMAGNGHGTEEECSSQGKFSINERDKLKSDFDNEIRIIYAGGLHLSRADKLLEFQNYLAEISTIKCRLHVYTFEKDRQDHEYKFDKAITTFFPSVSNERIREVYKQGDALLYAEDVNKDNYELIKYSMSSKIPQFLSSKKPIICFSKPGTSTYAYLKRNEASFFIEDAAQLNDVVLKIHNHDSDVIRLVGNACSAAERDFNIFKQRQEMHEILRRMAKVQSIDC